MVITSDLIHSGGGGTVYPGYYVDAKKDNVKKPKPKKVGKVTKK